MESADLNQVASEKPEPCGLRTAPRGYLNSKSVAFVGIMSALGAVLALFSTISIPLGPGVSVDLSHVGTYIVAIGGGPILGAITAALAGVIPSFQYANPAVIPGKMLTGFSVGALYIALKRIRMFKENPRLIGIPIIIAGILGYLPEYLFTIWDLNFITSMAVPVIITILAKGWIEITAISILTAALYSRKAIREEIDHLVGKSAQFGKVEYAASAMVITLCMLLLFAIYLPGQTVPQDVFIPIVFVMLAALGVLVIYIVVQLRKNK